MPDPMYAGGSVQPPSPGGGPLIDRATGLIRGIDAARPSCDTCPAFLPADAHHAQRERIGRATAAPACARGYLVGSQAPMSEAAATRLLTTIGASCPDYGQPWDAPATANRTVVTVPDEQVELTVAQAAGGRPATCTACRQFLPADEMLARFAIPHPACAVGGHLLQPGDLLASAAACRASWAVTDFDREHRDWSRIYLREPYAEALLTLDPRTGSAEAPPPRPLAAPPEDYEYRTDREVTAADSDAGIVGWRQVEDPDGHGAPVFLPVFDPADFEPEQRAKIPATGGDGHPELYRDHLGLVYTVAVAWLHLGGTPALNGPAGVGKTELFRHLAWLMRLPFERISITNSTELDDLQGKMLFEGGQTVFRYGRIPAAWARPGVIVIDEPNVGPPDVWHFLRPLTDDSKQLVLDANRGERIVRHRFSFLGMAFNPSWDARNVGARDIADADGSRLLHLAVPAPAPAVERAILAERTAAQGLAVPGAVLDTIVKIGTDLRALADQDALPIQWGLRQQVKVAALTPWFPLEKAYRLAAANYLEPEYCEQILITVRSHMSSDE